MAKIFATNPHILVSCGMKVIVNSVDQRRETSIIEIPTNIPSGNKGNECNEDKKETQEESKLEITTGDISNSGKYVVLCTTTKIVSLWETSTLSLISNRISARVASKVKFFPSEDNIVLADKSGDVYEFSVVSPHLEGKLLLGHLSMLLDVLVTPDERYIVTCDRDEKIRVTCYPNSYNIQSYCLGHREFVTGIFLLPHDATVLVSASGDGSVRFWNYETGVQIYEIECSAESSLYHDINRREMEDGDVLPVRLITSCIVNSNVSIITCCLSKVQGCLIYQVDGKQENIKHKLIQVIRLHSEPWDVLSFDKQIWIIGPKDKELLSVYVWDTETCKFVICSKEEILAIVAEVNNRHELFKNIAPAELTLLYKRKFDNVQEYKERKKQRLAGITPSSCANLKS